jgi:hypothetical protein
MQIHSIITEVQDARTLERNFDGVKGFMVHRCGVDLKREIVLGYDAVSVCHAFQGKHPKYPEVARATGGENPYTLMIGGDLGPSEYDGRIWQCLPADEIGHHGRRWSRGWMGVAVIADPRERAMSSLQHESLVDVLVELCIAWAKDPLQAVRGHGECDGAHDGTKAPGHYNWCPGFDMDSIRLEVMALLQERGRRKLQEAGLVFQQ